MKNEPDWRDIVAMFAMHSILQKSKSTSYENVVDHSYKMADLMIKAMHNPSKSERKKNEREDD